MKRLETALILVMAALVLITNIAWQREADTLQEQIETLEERNAELQSKIDELQTTPMTASVIMVEPDPEPEQYIPVFPLSDVDRDLIERVVMAESGNQPLDGQIAVASCIYNTAVDKGMNPADVVQVKGQYASPYQGDVTDSAKQAVAVVFDEDKPMEDVKYFYSTVGGFVSAWHENALEHIVTIADHKFFGVR